MTRIRTVSDRDRAEIRDLYLGAFPEGENAVVADLAVALLEVDSQPDTIAFVAEEGDRLVGEVSFSPVTADADSAWLGYILAPLAVSPEYQRRGVGSRLVESGLAWVSARGADALFVYGDPRYYARFGFRTDVAERFRPPYGLRYPFGWQAIVLHESAADQGPVTLSCVAPLRDPALW